MRNNNPTKMKQKYSLNKTLKVGDNCICPSCGSHFEKSNYQQAFCKILGKTKCKDKYWNTVIPHKRNNRTRISPASARYMQRVKIVPNDDHKWDDDDWVDDHPFSSDALGQD